MPLFKLKLYLWEKYTTAKKDIFPSHNINRQLVELSMTETVLIDFMSEKTSPVMSVQQRVAREGIVVGRATAPINPGAKITTSQFTLFMHESAPIELTCHLPDGNRETHAVSAGQFHISPANRPAYVGWGSGKRSLIVALDNSFIERAVGDAFDGRVPEVRNKAALRDPAIEELAACLRREMDENGRSSRLCLEHVATSLAVRLFETHGESASTRNVIKGGLPMRSKQRAIEYVDAHLSEDISLAALAAEAGFSPHHFGKAFKASLGMPPCQYVTRARLRQAMGMLLNSDRTITEIAYEVGFPSHSHFCAMFKKQTGMTPSQYRKNRF